MKTLKKIKLDMWINAIMTVLLGVLFIIISIPPPLAGGTNSNESVSTLYTVF